VLGGYPIWQVKTISSNSNVWKPDLIWYLLNHKWNSNWNLYFWRTKTETGYPVPFICGTRTRIPDLEKIKWTRTSDYNQTLQFTSSSLPEFCTFIVFTHFCVQFTKHDLTIRVDPVFLYLPKFSSIIEHRRHHPSWMLSKLTYINL
jgi:hypothetical protein